MKKQNQKEKKASNSTYVELRGTFSFSINQNGLKYTNKEERQQAIDDFWNEFYNFQNTVNEMQQSGYLSLDYKQDDLVVVEGED